jgi:DNA polymerase III delta' subunit
MQILGHQKIRQHLALLLAQNRVPQAAIFYGVDGIGKKRVAFELAQKILCENSSACGECSACHTFQARTHPDFHFVEPSGAKSRRGGASARGGQDTSAQETPSQNTSIKIEQIHELKDALKNQPFSAAHHIVVIDDAQKLTTSAANSLLKFLEEPRATQIFILIANNLHGILPTIRSRLAKFYFVPPVSNDIKMIVKSQCPDVPIDEKNLDFLIRCFQGSIGRVCEALEQNLDVTPFLQLMDTGADFVTISKTVKEFLTTDTDLRLVLQGLRQYCVDVACQSDGVGSQDKTDFFDKISRAERQLDRFIPKELVLENLFLV